MRAEPTDGEAVLWRALRRRQLGGWKFRRQHVIAGYIVDFYCAELWLALEVDGSSHDDRAAEDERRDAALEALGVRVVHLRNADVLQRLDEVRQALGSYIASAADHRPSASRPR
jgi:very-short-patch-repair endonuclease